MEMTNRPVAFDLAIIGGGPAGCAASIRAARCGARVLLLERGKFPRHKVCGEFVSAESLHLLADLLGSDLRDLLLRVPRISEIRIFLNGRTLHAEISPAAASITRFDLDAALWSASAAAGVECHSETAAWQVERSGHFCLTVGAHGQNPLIEAKAVINASGRWSNFTSAATRARLDGERWIGIKAHFREPGESHSVDLYFFEGGYCGVQPVSAAESASGTRVNACAMVRADVASTINEVLNLNPELRKRALAWEPLMDAVTTSPLLFHEPEPAQHEMLQLGDAAAFVDPFVGDGISLALRSGALASECLLPFFRSQCSLEQVLEYYTGAYQKQLSHVFNTSSMIRGLLRWPQAIRKPVLSVLAKTPFITERIVRITR